MMGAREFLFLWSMSLDRGYPWPKVLETTVYSPRTDHLEGSHGVPGRVGHTTFNCKVNREGSASCDILKQYGFLQDDIDAAVKKYLGE